MHIRTGYDGARLKKKNKHTCISSISVGLSSCSRAEMKMRDLTWLSFLTEVWICLFWQTPGDRGILYALHNLKVELVPVTTRHAVNNILAWRGVGRTSIIQWNEAKALSVFMFHSCSCSLTSYLTYIHGKIYCIFVAGFICQVSNLVLVFRSDKGLSDRCRFWKVTTWWYGLFCLLQ